MATAPGTTYRAEWVAVPDRDATTSPTHTQFADGEVTRSRKLEGMWLGDDGAYFVCSFARFTNGSAAQHDGQDNIAVPAYPGLIIAEDGDGKQHLAGSTERGHTFFFARNDHPDDAEFTGPDLSLDKKTLFACIQSPGHVFAIRGPFTKQR